MRSLISILFIGLVGLSWGCSQASNVSTSNANANQVKTETNANVNANKTEVSSAPASETAPPGSLATPTEAYKTAYAIREKKDVAGMKRILSDDMIEFLTLMSEDTKTTLDDQIKKMFEKPQAKTAEVRNEKINGDRASLEYLDAEGKWKTIDFEKVGNEWKLTFPKPEPGEIEIESGVKPKKP